jgi:hypothetical protein
MLKSPVVASELQSADARVIVAKKPQVLALLMLRGFKQYPIMNSTN